MKSCRLRNSTGGGEKGRRDGIREKEEEVLRVAGCALPCNLLRPSSADR